MPKTKNQLGRHSRLSRRARHLIALLKRTRAHSVRLAILRELQHEMDRIRRGGRRAGRAGRTAGRRTSRWGQALQDRAVEYARHLGNRARHGGTHHCDACGTDIRGGIGAFNAHHLRHLREDETSPRERKGRTAEQKARDHARDHLEGHGLRGGRDLGGLPEDRPMTARDLKDRHRARNAGVQPQDREEDREGPCDRGSADAAAGKAPAGSREFASGDEWRAYNEGYHEARGPYIRDWRERQEAGTGRDEGRRRDPAGEPPLDLPPRAGDRAEAPAGRAGDSASRADAWARDAGWPRASGRTGR